MSPNRRTVIATLLLAATPGLAACGGGSGDSSKDSTPAKEHTSRSGSDQSQNQQNQNQPNQQDGSQNQQQNQNEQNQNGS